jgi:hypothetical protein
MKDLVFQKAEYEATLNGLPRVTRGWAMKTATPPVHFSLEVRQELAKLFSQKDPYVQPEEAVVQILCMPEFRNDIFLANMLTAARVKSYFGRLVVQKKKMNRDAGLPLPTAIAESKTYENLTTRKQLVDLIRERNIHTTGSLARQNITALVELLRENDAMKEHAETKEMDEDEEHVAEACTVGGLDATEQDKFVAQTCGSAVLAGAGDMAFSQIHDDAILAELDAMTEANENELSDGEDDESSVDEKDEKGDVVAT